MFIDLRRSYGPPFQGGGWVERGGPPLDRAPMTVSSQRRPALMRAEVGVPAHQTRAPDWLEAQTVNLSHHGLWGSRNCAQLHASTTRGIASGRPAARCPERRRRAAATARARAAAQVAVRVARRLPTRRHEEVVRLEVSHASGASTLTCATGQGQRS